MSSQKTVSIVSQVLTTCIAEPAKLVVRAHALRAPVI
jgi:hypothetical protein